MDPLGARSPVVDVQTLPRWADSLHEGDQTDSARTCGEMQRDPSVSSPFPHREDINRKIILWMGDVALLNGTAIVNTSNEMLSEKNSISDSIHLYAGPELREELQKLKGCRTGEAKMTKGFNLAARYIIHTVGPRYNPKYRTAAESSLYSCYRNIFLLAREHSMSSVGLCVINTLKRCYPLEDATNIALRTVRRFLEKHGDTIETVVFAVTDLEEAAYRRLMPLYFPRSLEEERRCLPFLPVDIGNAEGEPVIAERQIRILDKPGISQCESVNESDEEGLDLEYIGMHAFAKMEGDIDKQRRLILQGQMSEAAVQKAHQRNYNRWLCRARADDLSDIAALKALYQTGVDKCGRTVVVIVGRNIPMTLIDPDKALLYFIHIMDHIAVREFVMVYFHTLTNDHHHPNSEFLKRLYEVVDVKYKKNLKAFYFVNPTFRSKVMTWIFTTFSVSGLKDKVHYIENLPQLYAFISPEQIDIPPFVLECNARVSVTCYS
uniref:Ganglioside induced differentiation associated protein 2 n=1 Tax=Callorhinchus milii TaxID=7868 RepID=A0A4W3GK49_CALMI